MTKAELLKPGLKPGLFTTCTVLSHLQDKEEEQYHSAAKKRARG